MATVSLRLLLLVLPLLSLAAPAAAQDRSCNLLLQTARTRDIMADIYFWYREIPDIDLASVPTPERYLDAVRHRPLDASFSYITTEQANTAFYSDSQFVGFGFSTLLVNGELRVSQVFPGSPAQDALLQRGDRITSIDGRAMGELIATNQLGAALGAAEIGVSRELAILRGGVASSAVMVKRLVTIPTVSYTRVIDVDGRKVGYVFFRNFVEPSFAALDEAFTQLRDAGVTELVLDLRYNGGGLVSVAQHLASLIGGTLTQGQVFAEYFHNDRNGEQNRVTRFEAKTNALRLNRLFVLTTRASASASELVINALRPFMPVVVIGERTYGKPVGQYSFTFCQKVLVPVSFTLRNANGDGDFFDGLPVTCRAGDDVDRQLGDATEGSLGEAITVIRTGGCSTSGLSTRRAVAPAPASTLEKGWQELVGAH